MGPRARDNRLKLDRRRPRCRCETSHLLTQPSRRYTNTNASGRNIHPIVLMSFHQARVKFCERKTNEKITSRVSS